ncbi:MAG: restriction endonuclease subunit S [Polyangiaceae bacterium]
MPRPEWREVRIRDLGRVITGKTPPGNSSRCYGTAVPFLTPSDFDDFRRVEKPGRFLSDYGAGELRRCLVPQGVGVSCIGWQMGKAVLIERPTITNQQINSIIVDEDVATRAFVYYSLRLRRHEIFTLGAGGSRTPILNKGDFERLPFVLPSLAEQRAIAHILGTLDDKIELNRRMNETLEAMARALFQSWFVDFDPVRAKAEGRAPSGMDAETANLFPSELVDSDLGPIPKGWRWAPVTELTSYLSRGIGPAYTEDGGVVVLNQKCIRDHRVDLTKARRHDPARKPIEGRLVRDLDVLVNSTGVGTLGRVAQLRGAFSAIVDSHVTIVRAASTVDPWFLGTTLLLREPEIEALGEGSTGQTELSRSRLGGLLCVTPDHAIQRTFGNAIGATSRRSAASDVENEHLARTRDALLPKLLSGEISVAHAERDVEAAI